MPQGGYQENLTTATPWDFRIVAAVMDVNVTVRPWFNSFTNETSFIPINTVNDTTAVICKVGYRMQRADVSATQGTLSNLVLGKEPATRK